MTQNLRLTGSRTLTPANSDVSSNWTLPAQNTGTWCTDYDETCANTANNLDSGNDTDGTYYSWAAATAGTGTYSVESGNASSSICPKGWRLPTVGSSGGEFQALYGQYDSADKMRSNDTYADLKGPAFILSGYRYGGSTSSQGSSGYYWSSTALNADYAYRLSLNSWEVYPAYYDTKHYGFSVRCIAR